MSPAPISALTRERAGGHRKAPFTGFSSGPNLQEGRDFQLRGPGRWGKGGGPLVARGASPDTQAAALTKSIRL